ncbi:arsenate reductase ArsC [Pandoraea bronchicola]|uniref:Protein tyrosine phosphatase n=1 Tax=Pandoraea bronchicola TaxID=2508287 RepID=A0A5E5BN05_9BURK|nr:arsenate reductase ArsC [Pandoraea bronchicola]VVE87074.1 protein tyrosine phosphatase [Pandoraea bronchicola]
MIQADTTKRHVLFLCTHNSARSILAEAILNDLGGNRFVAFSAGSQPSGHPNPYALELLASRGTDTSALRSKSWDEFAQPGAPRIDFIVTVCDNAAGETCPLWPGHPAKAHWGVPDPSQTPGTPDAVRKAFLQTYLQLRARIELLLDLPLEKLDPVAAQQQVQEIGNRLRAKEA